MDKLNNVNTSIITGLNLILNDIKDVIVVRIINNILHLNIGYNMFIDDNNNIVVGPKNHNQLLIIKYIYINKI